MSIQISKEAEDRILILCQNGGGVVTPSAVVEDARDPKSPLHRLIEWDDSKAAQEYRLDQARAIIRAVRVETREETQVVRSVCYVHDPSAGGGQGYRSVAHIRTELELAREAFRAELLRALAAVQRANKLAAALGVPEAREMDKIAMKMTVLSQKVEILKVAA